jgi:hypothetical protein
MNQRMGSSLSASRNLPEEERVPKDAGPKAERAYREALSEFWSDLREQPLSVLGLKYGGRFVNDPRVQQLLQDPRWKQTFGEESVEAAQTIMGLVVRVGTYVDLCIRAIFGIPEQPCWNLYAFLCAFMQRFYVCFASYLHDLLKQVQLDVCQRHIQRRCASDMLLLLC